MAKKEAAKVQENKTVELSTAKDLMKQIAQKEAEKASEYVRREAAAEREKKALMERLGKASGLSDEEALRRATDPASLLERIDRSAGAPFSKQPVYGWRSRDQQLGARVGEHPRRAPQGDVPVLGSAFASEGIPAAIQIVDFPKGMPGDIGIILSWADK